VLFANCQEPASMKKIIQERIIRTEEEKLSEKDRADLLAKRNKKLLYLLTAYIPLALILSYVYFSGPSVAYRDNNPYPRHEITDDDIKNFSIAAPLICGFLFLMLTGFFLHYYLQSVAPLLKDLRNGKKLLLFIKPEKTEMAFFNKYFIATPIFKKQQVQISREDFNNITSDKPLILELAPHSHAILRFTNDGKEITFY
jgi:hypothetical protein